ncbi:MAG: hypothetical protein E6K65_11360 [Nitrospirae bacterium]|nr:MAG: hypothetical protein E6K65_11360 [Nitrospirota bacterium]
MDSPKSETLSHETQVFAIRFEIVPEQIGFELSNKSSLPIRILWDECAYIDPSGGSFRVLHEGVRFIDRDKPMAATIVPPGASVRDLAYPTAYVSWPGSDWTQKPLFTIGQSVSFGIFLTLEIGGQKKSLLYKFAAVSTQPDWPRQIKSLFMP